MIKRRDLTSSNKEQEQNNISKLSSLLNNQESDYKEDLCVCLIFFSEKMSVQIVQR